MDQSGPLDQKTVFNNKKHGGTKIANSAKLPQQPTPTSHFQPSLIHRIFTFLSLNFTHDAIKKAQNQTIFNR